jgi:flagellar biosynthetic protein FliR
MMLLEISTIQFEKFLFILLRVGGIMTIAPLFGHGNIPKSVKLGFIGIVSLILVPIIPAPALDSNTGLGEIFMVAAKEVSLGLIIGFISKIVFLGVQMAGHMIGFQMGFMVAQVIDPSSGQQVSILGQFKFILAILIFLAIDGHHLLINAVVGSFNVIPIGDMVISERSAELMVRACVDIFLIAVKIGSPIIVTLFLTDVALGIIARTVPQMNIFIVGFPIKISAGFLALAVSFPFISYLFSRLIHSMDRSLTMLMIALSGRT